MRDIDAADPDPSGLGRRVTVVACVFLLGLLGAVLILFSSLLLFGAALSYGEASERMETGISLVIVGVALMGVTLLVAAGLVLAAPNVARWLVLGCVPAGFVVILLPSGLEWGVPGLAIWGVMSVVLIGVAVLMGIVSQRRKGSAAQG